MNSKDDSGLHQGGDTPRVGSLVEVNCVLGPRARVYPLPAAAEDSYEVSNGLRGVVIETGAAPRGSYYGELRVVFADVRVGWIPTVHVVVVVA